MDAQEYIKANVLEAEEAQEYAEKCLETALQDIESLKKEIEGLKRQIFGVQTETLKIEGWIECEQRLGKENEKLKREKMMVLKQNKQLQKCYAAAQRETDIEHVRYLDEQVKVGALKEDLKRVMKERNYLGDYVGGATSDEEDEDDQ